MSKRNLFVSVLLAIISISFANGQADNSGSYLQPDGSVYLPSQLVNTATVYKSVEDVANKDQWQVFFNKNGNWTILFDGITGMPHRAFGKPIRLEGFDAITPQNIEEYSLAFIKHNEKLFKVSTDNLVLRHKSFVNNRWYVSYAQYYNGLEVLLSEVELRIFINGNIMAFGIEYYTDIEINTTPGISPSAAAEKASFGLTSYNLKSDKALSTGKLLVLPVKFAGKINYRLVYEVKLTTTEPAVNYTSYVDAHNGSVVWRINQTHEAVSKIKVKGYTKMRYPVDNDTLVDLPEQYVYVDAQRYTTDKYGNATFESDIPGTVSAKLEGKWAKVLTNTGSIGMASATFAPGSDVNLEFNNANSHKYERCVYYHTNYIHDYIARLDTGFKGMDFQMMVRIFFQTSGTNAMSFGDSIWFTGAGSTTQNFVESVAILYHEYGHSINRALYMHLGKQAGMINSSCNEGMADINSAFILDDNIIGKYAFNNNPTQNIRNVENTNYYPANLSADSHYNGLILSGAFWDIRKAIGLDYARHLSHFTKYGTPDDPNLGIAFNEWFIETLIADDDDGDLTNGTPKSDIIIDAFNKHGIGTSLFIAVSLKHTPLSDTQDTEDPYTAMFQLQSVSIVGAKPQNVRLAYLTSIITGTQYVDATEYEPNKYKADIPAQKEGTIVTYYFTCNDPFAKKNIDLSADFSKFKPYSFLVGFKSAYENKFAEADGWITRTASDQATQGFWEFAKPNLIDLTQYGVGVIQPGSDYDQDGSSCFVTGAGGSASNYSRYIPNGSTTLLSKVFNISGYDTPIVKFQRWFFNMQLINIPGYEAYWNTEFSSDGGTTWKNAIKSLTPTNGWEQATYKVEDYVQKSETFMMRIVLTMPRSTSPITLTEALLDHFTILAVNPPISVKDDGIARDLDFRVSPNPAGTEAMIGCQINIAGNIDLTLWDLMGTKIATIANGYFYPDETGMATIPWNCLDSRGSKLPAGIYIVKLNMESISRIFKVVVK